MTEAIVALCKLDEKREQIIRDADFITAEEVWQQVREIQPHITSSALRQKYLRGRGDYSYKYQEQWYFDAKYVEEWKANLRRRHMDVWQRSRGEFKLDRKK